MSANPKLKRVLAIVALVVLGPFVAWYGWKELQNSRKLAASGLSTTGTVIEATERRGRRSFWSTYYLQVEFKTATGAAVSKKVKVDKTTFASSVEGRDVKVHYLAENPEICAAGDKVDTKYGQLLIGILMVFGAGFLAFTSNTPIQTES